MDIPGFFQVTLGGLLGSSIATTILGALFLRWSKTVEAEIKAHFDQGLKVFESTRAWKQQALFELLGPLNMHFERTKSAFDRWKGKNLFLEAQIVRQGYSGSMRLHAVFRDTTGKKYKSNSLTFTPHR